MCLKGSDALLDSSTLSTWQPPANKSASSRLSQQMYECLIVIPAQIQDKLAAQLDAAGLLATPGKPEPRDFEWPDLNELPYLTAVIKETLRKYSPAAMGGARCAPTDMELCGYHVPKVCRGSGYGSGWHLY